MSEQQRFEFFNKREAQREKVKCKVKKEREQRAKKSLVRILEQLGIEQVKTIIVTEHLKITGAANDPLF